METTTNRFDPATARRIKKNVAGSPHAAFADADGNICLLARGRPPGDCRGSRVQGATLAQTQ